MTLAISGGTLLQGDVHAGTILVDSGRIIGVGPDASVSAGTTVLDARGGYVAPGFIDVHVHGGGGADFMDATPDAFRTACRAHARHGSTALLATTTVARHEQH